MEKCDICRLNKNGYCSYFGSRTVTSSKEGICTAFKPIIKKTTNDTKRKAIKQETRLAKDIGAKRTPRSGADPTSPSDMVLGNYVIESKATKGKSINVKEEWLSSLKRSPMHFGKIPTLILEFPNRKRYIVMEEEDFKKIIDEK